MSNLIYITAIGILVFLYIRMRGRIIYLEKCVEILSDNVEIIFKRDKKDKSNG